MEFKRQQMDFCFLLVGVRRRVGSLAFRIPPINRINGRCFTRWMLEIGRR